MAATLALTQIQLGTNPTTPTNNFVILGDGTGTLVIGAGNANAFSERFRLASTGVQIFTQGPEVSQNTSGTLSISQLQSGIVTSNATVSLALPAGSILETFSPNLPINSAFEVVFIATGSNTITLTLDAEVTAIGNLVVPANSSGRFRFRKTALNTFIVYRV